MQDFPEKKSLRERRRQETARQIQRSAVALARQHGIEQVTTEMIARAAGISTRTFFNYYSNKEAALIGHPTHFPPEALAAFKASGGPLIADLHHLMCQHAAFVEQDRLLIESVPKFARESLKVSLLFDAVMLQIRAVLVEAIAARKIGDRLTTELLADIALAAARTAVERWIDGRSETLAEAMDDVWSRLGTLGRLLTPE